MRLLIAGDWHGSLWHAEWCMNRAREYGITCIVQLGDFGYWEHQDDGKYLDQLSHLAKNYGITVYWIDGNHENHVLLRSTYCVPERTDENGFVKMRDRVFYIPRGTVWEWAGVKFLGLGGAFSIDRNQRRVGSSFWFEETLTDEEVELACENGKDGVDVMFAHDAFTGIDLGLVFAMRGKYLSKSKPSDANRDRVKTVLDAVRPSHFYHGHYHAYYRQKFLAHYGPVSVVGLDCDGTEVESVTVLDTAQFNVV